MDKLYPQETKNMKNLTPRRTWTKPEIVSVVSANKAQIGNNSMTVDQGFPAANGTTAHFS
jgi:hypothetical protein